MRTNRITMVATALLAVTACDPTDAEPEVTVIETDDTLSTADIELMALELTWDAGEVCPIWLKLEAKIDAAPADQRRALRAAMEEYAIESFEEGYGESLTPVGRAAVIDRLRDC